MARMFITTMTEVPTLLPTRRYQWVELPGAVGDELIDQAIKRSIDEQLAEKGLTKVEKDADLYVGYQAAINLEKSVNLRGTGDGFRPWGGWGQPYSAGPDFYDFSRCIGGGTYTTGEESSCSGAEMPARPSTSKRIRTRITRTCKRLWPRFLRIIRPRPVNRRPRMTEVVARA